MKPAHECLEYGKKDTAVGRNLIMFAHGLGFYAYQSVFRERPESIKCLVGKDIPVGEK
jgi:hypothetical protein